MENFVINGKQKLYGKIDVDCSKNAILPIMCASIMCSSPVTINNVTYYDDVLNMIAILKHLGVSVECKHNTLIIDSSTISKYDIPIELSSKLRASIFFLGPLLSVFKKNRVAYPGGCSIGARPIDIHINGLKKLGVKVLDRHGIISCSGDGMMANNLCLPFPSVGATENLIMASVLLNGTTTISGVAKEPEIIDLCKFLNKMGAKIFGAGTDTISITGVKKLFGAEYTPISDRIIAGSYIFCVLATGGEVEINNINSSHLVPIIDLVANNACKIFVENDKIIVESKTRLNGFGKVETMPYPFFPTDLGQPLSALASVCLGNTLIVENLFENRFNHIPELSKMGASITIKDRTAFIEGTRELYGANVDAQDLRGGMALVIAGLTASGYTTISNAQIIDRGYKNIEQKLSRLGADIKRVNS